MARRDCWPGLTFRAEAPYSSHLSPDPSPRLGWGWRPRASPEPARRDRTAVCPVRRGAAAKTCRAVGNSCNGNGDCCSHNCVKASRTRKLCRCESAADCPAAPNPCLAPVCNPDGSCGTAANVGAACDDGDACTQGDACDARGVCVGGAPVVCPTGDVCVAGACCTPEAATTTCGDICGPATNNCGQTLDCGAVGAPCTPPYYPNIPVEDGPPLEIPGIGCCEGLVCQGSPFPLDAPKPGSCQVNRPPTAVPFNVKFPWQQDCNPVTLAGLDPDNNGVVFNIVTQPTNGFLTKFVPNMVPVGGSFAGAPSGVRALPVIDGHICLDGNLPDEPNDGLGDAENVPFDPYRGLAQFQCAEGTYFYFTTCYVTFSPTFTGSDSFAYTATDIFGAVSDPVIVTITVFEVP